MLVDIGQTVACLLVFMDQSLKERENLLSSVVGYKMGEKELFLSGAKVKEGSPWKTKDYGCGLQEAKGMFSFRLLKTMALDLSAGWNLAVYCEGKLKEIH